MRVVNCIILTLCIGVSIHAATIHVPADQPTIQAGINAAVNGDTVLVAPGSYLGNLIVSNKEVHIVSETGPIGTIILVTSETNPKVQFINASGELSGFAFADQELNDRLIRLENSTITISNNVFQNLISPSEIIWGENGAGLLDLTLERNIFTHARGNNAMCVFVGSGSVKAINNTILAANRGMAVYVTGSTVKNNIFSECSEYALAFNDAVVDEDYNCFWSNNRIRGDGGSIGSHAVLADPEFLDTAGPDLNLRVSSPCIDAGDPNPDYNDSDGTRNDIGALPFGNTRPAAVSINFGIEKVRNIVNHQPAIYWSFYDPGETQQGFEVEVGIDLDWSVAEQWSTGATMSSDTSVAYQGDELLDGTTYFLRLRVYNGTAWGGWSVRSFRMNSKPSVPLPLRPIGGAPMRAGAVALTLRNSTDTEFDHLSYDYEIYADPSGAMLVGTQLGVAQQTDSTKSGKFSDLLPQTQYWWHCRSNDGYESSDWSSLEAFITSLPSTIHVPADAPTIQAGVEAAEDGDTVLVAPGVHTGNILVTGKQVDIVSEQGPAATTIVWSSDSGPKIRILSSYCRLAGFTFADQPLNDKLVFVQNSSATISNNVFRNLVSPTEIIWGESGEGSLQLTLSRNLFAGASGNNAMCVFLGTGSVVFVNNTIYSSNRGMALYVSGSTLKNNIFAQCSEYAIAFSGATVSEDYNCYWQNVTIRGDGGPIGSHDILVNPEFVNAAGQDFHLLINSPCINAGDPDPAYNDPDSSRSDMGAFPLVPVQSPPVLSPIGNKTVGEGSELTFRVSASDPNGTTPSLMCVSQPEGSTFTDSSNGAGSLVWTPTYQQSGLYHVLFIASDGALADSEDVQITVNNVVRPPSVAVLTIDGFANPTNVLNNVPVIRWDFTDPEDLTQTRYEIAVGTDTNWTYAEMWNPAPVNSADTFVTYGGAPLVDGATYYLRLRVHNGYAWSPWYQTSFRMNSVPSVPVPKSPSNDALAGSMPTLWVTSATDAESDPLLYEFAGFHDTDCVGPAIAIQNVPGTPDSTGGQVTSALAENCRYRWQVRAYDGYEYSDWSSLAQFRVDGVPEAPTTPELTSPPLPDGKPVFTLLPTLKWSTSYDPDPLDTVRYKVEISPFFVKDSLLADSLKLTDSLEFSTRYFWRVTAWDKTHHNSVSTQKSFWTWTLGDINHSHLCDLSDLSSIVSYLTGGGYQISPKLVGDLNGNCFVDLTDLSIMVSYLTGGGAVFKVGCE